MIAGARKNYREQFQKMIYKKSLNIIQPAREARGPEGPARWER